MQNLEVELESRALKERDEEADKHPGIYTPLPIFVQPFCPQTKACCEDSSFCHKLGRVGKEAPLGVPRHKVMYFALFVSLVGMIMLIVGALALSSNATTVYHTAWAVGIGKKDVQYHNTTVSFDDTRISIGLNSVVIHKRKNDKVVWNKKWKNVDCDTIQGSSSLCDQCKAQALGFQVPVIIGMVTQVLQIATDVQRSTVAGDVNCQKFMGIFTGVLGLTATLFALGSFRDACYRVEGELYEMAAGPGFILTAVATILKAVDVICHVALATPAHKNQ